MNIKFIPNEPALMVGRTLVLGDLHLGYEYELAKSGILIPNQTERTLSRIKNIVADYNVKRVILLGDVKHEVTGLSIQEYKDLPNFFDKLSEIVEVILVKGNHDGKIEDMLHGIKVYGAHGFSERGVHYCHGNVIGFKKTDKVVITSHIHPIIKFYSGSSIMYERCWVIIEKEPRQIILPAFNDLVGGMAVNSDEFVNSVDAERTKIYLLDGTLLGYLSEIARAQHEA